MLGNSDVSSLGGFGSTKYDAGYPAGYFLGFTLSVDAVADTSLGGGWQSLSLGSMTMNTNDLPAGGYRRTTFREIERISYGEVSLSRPWVPGTSAHITEWFAKANKHGPTSVAVTVEVPSQSRGADLVPASIKSLLSFAGLSGDIGGQKFNIIFRNCLPHTWNAPSLQAGVVNSFSGGKMEPTTIESLTFSFSGYSVESMGGAKPMVDSSITNEERVEPCKLVIIPNTGSVTRKLLAKVSSWTVGQSMMGNILGAGSASAAATKMIAGMASEYDAIEFYLPPASMQIHKGASWAQSSSPRSSQAGPVSWMGTQPLGISFEFLMKTNKPDPMSSGGQSSGGGLFGALAGAAGHGGGALGYGKPRQVMDDLKKLIMLCENYSGGSLFSSSSSPPLVMLFWGEFVSPLSYVSYLSANIVRFEADGSPSKAVGSISLSQYPESSGSTNPTSGGLAPEMADTLLEGDTLAHLAYRSYQEPNRWRDIAEHNGIDDPLRMRIGRKVLLPSPEYLPFRTEGGTVMSIDEDDSFSGVLEDY
jgi:hypothetical protein